MGETKARAGDPTFEAPGPGSWELDQTHVARPMTRYTAEVLPEPFLAGFGNWMRRYGLFGGGLRTEFVNGFMYGQMQPPPEDEIPQRIANAAETFEVKRWRDDLDRWETEIKPATIARHRELVAVDVDALDDDALIAHLRECRDNHAAMIRQHHEFNGACIVPLGDFLNAASAWTGLPHPQLIELFAGASPVSAASSPELDALVSALRDDHDACQIVERDDDPAAILDALRAQKRPIPEALDAWLSVVGHRIIDGFDVTFPVALERPHLLVAVLRAALDDAPAATTAARVPDALESVRHKVPEEHRDAFAELYAEARSTYHIRDERGIYSDITAVGIVRRAMLAAGRRLAARGRLDDAELALDATLDELTSMLAGEGGPTSAELHARAEYREGRTVADAPPLLGDPPHPPPPIDQLPPPVQRVMGATFTVLGHLFGSSTAPHDDNVVRGICANSGSYEGTARLVVSIDDLDRVEPGDVLVTLTTAESANCALAIAGAVVTDHGGALSHAAIMAREFGIPAVVGTREATARIPDGALVRVDGTTGEVTWS